MSGWLQNCWSNRNLQSANEARGEITNRRACVDSIC